MKYNSYKLDPWRLDYSNSSTIKASWEKLEFILNIKSNMIMTTASLEFFQNLQFIPTFQISLKEPPKPSNKILLCFNNN